MSRVHFFGNILFKTMNVSIIFSSFNVTLTSQRDVPIFLAYLGFENSSTVRVQLW